MTDPTRSAIRWLRARYVTGTVADLLAGIVILIPTRMGETEFRLAMGFAAALMFGWTALLAWAYRKPMERRGVLLLTICPVITGLLATSIWSGVSGYFPVARSVPTSVFCVVLIVLFGFSYWKASRVA